MSEEQHWSGLAERGSFGAIRLMAWIYGTLGRRISELVLYPVVAYFFLRERASRRASRSYLDRVRRIPEAARHLRRGPRFMAPFWHYHEFALQMFDRMVLWGGGLSRFRMTHQGGEHLFKLARERRGGILFGAHVGSFDMARQLAGEHGLMLNVVMYTAHAERINRFFEQLDPSSRVRMLSPDPTSVHTAFEIKACIDRGELVGILGDRMPAGDREQAVQIEFLGERAPFPLSPFRMACLLGCPTFLSLCVRTGPASYETIVEPIGEGRCVPRGERDKAAEELARAFVRALEAVCKRYPYEWFNFFDFWDQELAS